MIFSAALNDVENNVMIDSVKVGLKHREAMVVTQHD